MAFAVIGVITAGLVSGCGNAYRPVVSAINPVGPASQPTKFAVAVSNPGPNSQGLLTIVDFSGDSVLSTPSIQANPTYFNLNGSGNQGYTINAQGALDSFAVSNPTALQTSNVIQTTLLAGANPSTISVIAGPNGAITYVPQAGRASVAALSGSSLLEELSMPATPVYVVGADGSPRVYALSGTAIGKATAVETTTSLPTISTAITVGSNPVYGVESTDLTRAYIVNQGSGTVSVINVVTNAPDLTTPTIPATGTLGLNPVWAQLVPTLSELVVVNAGDGVNPGTLSIINVPLCNAVTPVTNPNCNPFNPTDAAGFGTVLATVKVGVNPTMVSVLRNGSRAYVVNAGNASAGIEGSVSVVNLTTNTVTATIGATSSLASTSGVNSSPTLVYGHPNTIAATLADPTGRVYVTASDNKFMTIITTDTDTVLTHISLQGLGVRVLVTAP
jgi:YVTN family beta-propeller protein